MPSIRRVGEAIAGALGDIPLRDTAILSLLVDTGLRATEVVSLQLEDVTLTSDSAWLVVRRGKGRKGRQTAMGKKARMALNRYLTRERHASDPDERHVFLARNGTPLTVDGLDRLLYRLRNAAGREWFEGVSVGAHRWRHTSATRALELGTDLYTVSLGLGHSSLTTTQGYLRAVNAHKLRDHAVSPLDNL